MDELPSVQQINLLNNNQKDLKKGLEWIENYHNLMNPMKDKTSNRWRIPTECEGLLTIKKNLIFLNNYYEKFFVKKEYGSKREVLLKQIKGKIVNLYEESDKRYYHLKLLYEKELELRKEKETQLKKLQHRYNECRNELHLLKIQQNKLRKDYYR